MQSEPPAAIFRGLSPLYPPSPPPVQVLQGLSVFRGLTPRTLHAIAPLFEIREIIGGKSVFEEVRQ